MSSLILNSYNHPFKFLISSSRSFLLRPSFMGLVIFGEDILSWILLLFCFCAGACTSGVGWLEMSASPELII